MSTVRLPPPAHFPRRASCFSVSRPRQNIFDIEYLRYCPQPMLQAFYRPLQQRQEWLDVPIYTRYLTWSLITSSLEVWGDLEAILQLNRYFLVCQSPNHCKYLWLAANLSQCSKTWTPLRRVQKHTILPLEAINSSQDIYKPRLSVGLLGVESTPLSPPHRPRFGAWTKV